MLSLKNMLLGMATIVLLAACGSDNTEPEVITAPDRPVIEQDSANPVEFIPGSYDRPFDFAESDDKWFIADRARGILSIDKDTDELVDIAGYKANSEDSLIESIASIALNKESNALYVLDTQAKQIVIIDLASPTNPQTQLVNSENFSATENFNWYAPTDLVYDGKNNRLLVADRYGLKSSNYFAFAVFSINLADKSVSVIAADENVSAPIQSFEARAMVYDEENEDFYISGLSQLSQKFYYSAYRIHEADWNNTLLALNTNVNVDRTSASHGIEYSLTKGLFLIDSTSQSFLNITFNDDETTTLRSIKISGDNKDYPLSLPTSFQLLENGDLLVLDEKLSALFSISYSITPELDDDGVETGYRTTSERTLLTSGRVVHPDPTTAPQTVFDMHFHAQSNQLIVTDSASTQKGLLTYNSTKGYEAWNPIPNLDNIEATEELYEVVLTDNQDIEDVRPQLTPAPKPIFVTSGIDGELIAYARGFLKEFKDPEIIDNEDGTQSARFYYNSYGPALYRIDTDTHEATPISTKENSEGKFELVSVPFSSADITGIADNNDGVYFLPNNPYSFGQFAVYRWDTQASGFLIVPINVASNLLSPKPTSIAYDGASGNFILSDAGNDALLELDINNKSLSTLSGRMNNGDLFFSLPTGVASNNSTLAYTFENSLKALISVDLTSGDRKRIDSPKNYIRSVSKLTLDTVGESVYLLEKLSQRIIKIDLGNDAEQSWLE